MKHLVIITGCSKGLGKALLEEFVHRNDTYVVGISRSEMASKTSFLHVQQDLANTASLADRIDEIFPTGDFDKVTLVNNAGWIGEIAPLGKLDPLGIRDIHLINVVAPAILMNAFVQKYGNIKIDKLIVNISSGAAEKNMDGWSGYCATKAALNRLTGVAQEESNLKGFGIDYFALSPGIVDTPMQGDVRKAHRDNFSNLEKFKSFKSNKELASPEEVATKISYLIDHPEAFSGVLQDVRKF